MATIGLSTSWVAVRGPATFAGTTPRRRASTVRSTSSDRTACAGVLLGHRPSSPTGPLPDPGATRRLPDEPAGTPLHDQQGPRWEAQVPGTPSPPTADDRCSARRVRVHDALLVNPGSQDFGVQVPELLPLRQVRDQVSAPCAASSAMRRNPGVAVWVAVSLEGDRDVLCRAWRSPLLPRVQRSQETADGPDGRFPGLLYERTPLPATLLDPLAHLEVTVEVLVERGGERPVQDGEHDLFVMLE